MKLEIHHFNFHSHFVQPFSKNNFVNLKWITYIVHSSLQNMLFSCNTYRTIFFVRVSAVKLVEIHSQKYDHDLESIPKAAVSV